MAGSPHVWGLGVKYMTSEQIQITFDELTHEEQKVWDVVRLYRGKENAIKGSKIAEWTGLEYDYIRSVIAHLINHHGYLIASCSKGYFIPQTSKEIFEATRSLRHRGIMILVRAAKLTKVSLEEIFRQGRMEFDEP